jgi:hypothetical protein
MTVNIEKIMSVKGQIVTLTTSRAMKVRKGESPITKKSVFQCRFGIVYDNMKEVKEKRISGELPEENAGLPWGEWMVFPYLIQHKNEVYVRCSKINSNVTTKVQYFSGDTEISEDEAQRICLASEFPKNKESSNVFNVKLSSIENMK